MKTADKRGKVAGLHTKISDNPGNVYRVLDRGFRMIMVSDVDTFIIQEVQVTLGKTREAAGKVKPVH